VFPKPGSYEFFVANGQDVARQRFKVLLAPQNATA
jgi:hypothetical protein